MAIGSNVTLVLANHLSIETAKLGDALLDGGPSMLKRALIGGCMDRVWHHIVLVSMVMFVDFLPILTPFARFHKLDQCLWPTKLYTTHLHGLECRTSYLCYLLLLSVRCLPNVENRGIGITSHNA